MDARTTRLAFIAIGAFLALLLVAVIAMSRMAADPGGQQERDAAQTDGGQVSTDDPVGQAARAEVEANLQGALSASLAAFTEGGSFTGFGAAVGETLDPSVTWMDGRPAEGASPQAVYVVRAADLTLVLAAVSSAGEFLCVQQDGGTTGYGLGGTWDEALASCSSPSWP